MTWSSQVVLEFGDGEFAFELKSAQVEELQRLCGYVDKEGTLVPVGFAVIFQRLTLGTWSDKDIQETIRLGLIGGGMGPVEARRKALLYAVPPYRAGQIGGAEQTAIAVVSAAMFGFKEAIKEMPPGESVTPKMEAPASETTDTANAALSTSETSEQPSSETESAPPMSES